MYSKRIVDQGKFEHEMSIHKILGQQEIHSPTHCSYRIPKIEALNLVPADQFSGQRSTPQPKPVQSTRTLKATFPQASPVTGVLQQSSMEPTSAA